MHRPGTALLALVLAAAAPPGEAPAPPLPPPRPAAEAPPALPPPQEPAAAPDEREAAAAACAERLTELGLRFEPRPDVSEEACSVRAPVLVSGLPEGIEVAPPSLMTCAVAEGLARWALEALRPEAERHLGTQPTKLMIGTSYQCRGQRSGSKLSEHAFGNAVDVMGIGLKGRAPVAVAAHPEGSPEAAFQAAVQKAACAHFTTVLGPGADADHGDHLHLDQRERNRGYRICQ